MRLKTARSLLHTVIAQASADPAYMRELRANPLQVLVEAGLPYDVIEDFLRESGVQVEVSAYAVPECATTCAVTRNTAYLETFQL